MSNLYRVLILLVTFFGLGISCASAANVVSFDPQTVEVYPGSSQDVRIVMDEVPEGISGFNITIFILNPEIAEITAVSFPDWGQLPRNSTLPSSSVWIKVSDLGSQVGPGDTNVLLGTITVTGKKAGTTDLGIPTTKISADGGSLISPTIITGNIHVLDNEAPVISSVSLSNSSPHTGNSITVTVDVTDNVGVSSVIASGVSLVNTGGNVWKGDITAIEGTHTVSVTASDAAGNTAVDESATYTATTTTSDTQAPIISSVTLSSGTPDAGASIVVTVDVTDNVGVSSVVASGVALVNTGGNVWKGNIVALEGIHSVNVSAVDEAGNVALDNSTSYTALTPDNLPPSSITNLQSTKGTTWIHWTWQNPKDADFNHTEIYLNGAYQTETSAEHFNATGLEPETSYTIGTRTVDINGNINEIWINQTAITEKEFVPEIKLPVANFTSNVSEGSAPLSVQFTDLSENAVSFNWNCGDVTYSTEKNPIHTYSTAGIYIVNLTVTNENGTDSKLATINISEKTVPGDNDTDEGTETQITTNNSRQSNPDIYEDRIVWIDWRNGNADIYMYDLFISTETQITNDEADQLNPDIYGDRIVWQDSRNGKSDLYMFNVSTSKETRITTSGSVYYGSEIYGDRIVWMDKRNSGSAPDDGFGGFDVYMYDLSTKKETRITKSTIPDNPDLNVFVDIYDNKIVWGPDMDGSNISVYDLSTSRQENVSSALQLYNIAFSGNRIVGTNNREGREGIVNMYDLSTATETKITSDFSAYGGPDISGNRIVWPDHRNSDYPPDSGSELDLYMYDLSTSTETQITTSKSVAWSTPSIYGDRVVWCDERNGNMDIYMFTLASDEVPPLDDNDTDEGNETDDDTQVPDNCSELTPLDNIQALKEYVESTYKCHAKTKIGQASLLDKSMCFYENGEDEKAISMLKSFIHLVERMKECKQISVDEADYMVKEAKKIIDQMDEGDRTDNGNKVPNNGSDNVSGCVTDEVCQETKPVCEETIPVCEPVCEVTKPVCKPICEETKPVCNYIGEVSSNTEKAVSEPVKKEEVSLNTEKLSEDTIDQIEAN
ncbi:PKD domain-containing protein [Methanosarcina sp. DH2]|uniref:PKD domain-containing protein n=1 Tax=Methanosarcina sp. DH2 TaxID=2605639 RepID=UPI001E29807E|nr:PKD domain-containing protein [Methanosarcina sp. DH2]MCC4770065.1 PKD domain-containing protein [Methanosarcina sp. DH2]